MLKPDGQVRTPRNDVLPSDRNAGSACARRKGRTGERRRPSNDELRCGLFLRARAVRKKGRRMIATNAPQQETITELVERMLETERFIKASAGHRQQARRVGELFREFAGFDPPWANITVSMLDLFEVWCLDAGRERSAAKCRGVIAGMLDEVSPEAKFCKPARRRRAKPREAAEGTLWHLFINGYQKRNRSSAETERQYRIQLDHLSRHLGHEPKLEDLSDEVLADFMDRHSKGRAASTANKAYWCLVALWRRAFDLGIAKKRPTVQPLAEPDQIPFAWFKEEVETLLRTCSTLPGNVGEIPARLWWLGLHWVIWSTGERIGAVLAIKADNADLRRGELFVPAEARKGRRKPKLYKLLPQAAEVLKLMQPFERELLFPCPWKDKSTLYYRYKRILRAAGLPTDRKCKFHRMRRSFASYIEAAGGNATEALDHSSRRVAQRSYLDPRICGGRNPAELLPAISVEAPEERN